MLDSLKRIYNNEFKQHCLYPQDVSDSLFAGRESITILDMLKFKIPDRDIIWLFTRQGMATEKQQRIFACQCAYDVIEEYENMITGDRDSRMAIYLAIDFANGYMTIEEFKSMRRKLFPVYYKLNPAISVLEDNAWDAASEVVKAVDRLTGSTGLLFDFQLIHIHSVLTGQYDYLESDHAKTYKRA